MIIVTNIVKQVKSGSDTLTILDKVSLSVNKGEILAVCGHSGSGKSSLLAVMSGISEPTEGEVVVDGTKIYALSRNELAAFRNKNFGIIFQNFNLIDSLTAKENVEVPLLLASKKGRSGNDPKGLLDMVGMADKAGVKAANLSGGEQQRVAIARAMVQNPGVLFADEPTGSLDHENSMNVLKLFAEIKKNTGVTIIIVTHEEYVSKTADRIVSLRYGKIEV